VTFELLALAALLFSDPSGDAHGAGDLVPPSAAVYASRAPFDLVEVRVADEPQLTIEVRLAGIPDPGGLPNGLTLPVIDLYLDTADGGHEASLPGPDMRMPPGRGWELALRVHGDDAYLRRAADPDGPARPVEVRRQGDRLRLLTGLPRPDEIRDVQALTGVYDPFARDGWRPLAAAPSPWAFSSEVAAPPVVDLLAEDDAAQRAALRSFVLPERRGGAGALPWLALMALGLVVAVVGLVLRRRVPAGEEDGAATGAVPLPSGGRASPSAATVEAPPGRTLPTRLAGRDGWWSDETPPEEAEGGASRGADGTGMDETDADEADVDEAGEAAAEEAPPATGAKAGEGSSPRTWPAPADRPPPLWSRASGSEAAGTACSTVTVQGSLGREAGRDQEQEHEKEAAASADGAVPSGEAEEAPVQDAEAEDAPAQDGSRDDAAGRRP
jgi:hypothetical protein